MHKILAQLKWEHQNLVKVLEILSKHLDHLLEGDDSDIDLILSLIHISEPTRPILVSRMPSSA